MGEELYCPICDSEEVMCIGTLGKLQWFRCRDCGCDFDISDPVFAYNGDDE